MSETAETTADHDVAESGWNRRSRGGRTLGHWILLSFAGGAALVLLVLGVFATPSTDGYGTHEQLGLPPCRSMELFGFPCPGCGVTTSMTMAAQGDVLGSIANQPFGFLTAALFAFLALYGLVGHLVGRDLFKDLERFSNKWFWIAVGVVALASWIYKILLVAEQI